ncbi:beta-ketoacyl synthase N-terminal-like domain-containing protein [Aquimarina sp. 2201CG5-10]|uniref:beta-ketoacyl synthase N-terminal-like domain-containing protein n=1 Tax=Aquimarina callyspongiae TaxID=3098150 RepID=UPI002AB357DD|nr:beta-ketoacyl synthase N-terminal-like domain-containing protein [Aquimarina sp. 2201CG5-10]MDY8135061.1 beta-ketoacyl synthase N-terminal-like domain-containing protein [Aquimarina sp. 2201CG5-10]
MQNPVSITGISSISPLGSSSGEIWKSYKESSHKITFEDFGDNVAPIARLNVASKNNVEILKKENSQYAQLDDSVLFAILVAREAIKEANWLGDFNFGINIGSSRGATSLFEKYHKEFLQTNKSSTLSSPTTTLGNLSSWIAQDLKCKGPEISHSITCSTALHAVLNGIAWIQSGLSDKFMVGGSEAPLTPFTIAQMKALKIYASDDQSKTYPCQAMNLSKTKNSMFLGEGAAVACLENGVKDNAQALITGIGYATESLKHNISISTEADCFQDSMKKALSNTPLEEVDAIVLHAPGTVKGDLAEYNSIKAVFGDQVPALTTNKWKIGHTFGSSGILSLELAILMMKHQEFIPVPFLEEKIKPKKLNKIIVNAVGFGGNAVSILLERPETLTN